LVPSLQHYPDWEFEFVVVDNSPHRLDPLAQAVGALPWPSHYQWHQGRNLLYGPSLNVAVRLARHPVVLYACANHGKMIDPRWVEDIVSPLRRNERAAMAGHPYGSPPARKVGIRYAGRRIHIQGGVFSARTEVLRRFPYDEGQHAHDRSDIVVSYRLLAAGFQLIDVPSVMSVWRTTARKGPWRYVHDDSED